MCNCVFDSSLRCVVCRTAIDDPSVKRNCRGRFRVLLGDAFEILLKAFGITEKLVSAVIGKPCGCNKRREKMNAMFGVRRAKDTT